MWYKYEPFADGVLLKYCIILFSIVFANPWVFKNEAIIFINNGSILD